MTKAKKKPKVYSLTERELTDMLAETVHTAFRKGSDHPSADAIWKEIRNMPNEEWGKVVDWMVWALFFAKKRRDRELAERE